MARTADIQVSASRGSTTQELQSEALKTRQRVRQGDTPGDRLSGAWACTQPGALKLPTTGRAPNAKTSVMSPSRGAEEPEAEKQNKDKEQKTGGQGEGEGQTHRHNGTEPEAASADRDKEGGETVGEKRRRETDADAVSFSHNLHRITGLGHIPRESGRGGEEEGQRETADMVREWMRRAKTHRKVKSAERTEDITEHKSLGRRRGARAAEAPPLQLPKEEVPGSQGLLRAGQKDHSWGWGSKPGSGPNPQIPGLLDKGGQKKKAEGPGHPGTSASLPPPATAHERTVGQSCPTGPGATPCPLCLMNTADGRVRQGWAQLWTRQKDGQAAKTCPRKSGPGLFSLAGGGHSGLHRPRGQSQD